MLDMASAYSTFADHGEHRSDYVISKVTDADGNVLFEHDVEGDQVVSEDVADPVNYALSQVVQGRHRHGGQDRPAGGRQDGHHRRVPRRLVRRLHLQAHHRRLDGLPRRGSLMKTVHGKSVTGGSFPAQIWQKYMSKATVGLDSCPFPKPDARRPTRAAPTTRSSPGPPPSSSTTPPSTAPASSTTTAPPSTTTPIDPAVDDHHDGPPTTTTTVPRPLGRDQHPRGFFAVSVGAQLAFELPPVAEGHWTGTGGSDERTHHRAFRPRPQGPARGRSVGDGHRLRRARRPHGRRGRRRHDPGRRLRRHGRARATTTPSR